ncbi:hypothetical protein GRX01_16255 [Halobaculum sp. WSA2]|uniref:Uncharacterized protein n=1 Tax=Halobaculum saliterrae TaxID=2073113 RepID=A0A6B0SWA1_9EURY|nr:hypothetical protein [Halobaculum saliterrae]MXR42887.1 hypothetical protein [Halobaculum saliterrae]
MSDDAPRGNPGVDPDDLDISKSEYVRELGDDRYVVSPDRRQPQRPPAEDPSDAPESEHAPDDPAATTDTAANEPGGPDVASTAESVREGLSPADGPGAAGTGANAASSSPPKTSSSPPTSSSSTERTTSNARGSGGDVDGSSRTPQSPDVGTDDGLPEDPTSGDGRDADVEAAASERPASHVRRGAPRGEAAASPSDLDAGAVGEWLAASLADTEFAYGFDATLSLDGRTARHRMASDDVGETFETLVTWFADAAGGDTEAEDALGILLAGMDTAPRLPANAVRSALAGLGVSRDDTVEDVLAALDEAGGLRLK